MIVAVVVVYLLVTLDRGRGSSAPASNARPTTWSPAAISGSPSPPPPWPPSRSAPASCSAAPRSARPRPVSGPACGTGSAAGRAPILAGLVRRRALRSLGGIVPIDFFAHRVTARSRRPAVGVALEHPEPARHLCRAVDGLRHRSRRDFGFDFTDAVLVIGAVIFFSNVMSGMWGVVAADFLQVAIILVGIPLTACGGGRATRAGAVSGARWPRPSSRRAWAREPSS